MAYNNRNADGTGSDDKIDLDFRSKLRALPKRLPKELERDETGRTTAMARMKDWRDRLLLASDWTVTTDSPLTDAEKAEWQTYRQALRDMPSTQTPKLVDDGDDSTLWRNNALDFTSFTFPTAPTGDIL